MAWRLPRPLCFDDGRWLTKRPHARRFYERALQAAPQDTSVMDALGEVLLGLGEAERAFEVGATLDCRGTA